MVTIIIFIAASLHIDYRMWFELWNAATEGIPHCGALEFITEAGMVYIPYWVLMECSCRSINILQYVLLTLYYDFFWEKKIAFNIKL